MTYERRQQATAHYSAATAAINVTFDAHDHLKAVVTAIRTATELPDPIAAVAELAALQRCLDDSLATLRAAASTAVTHRSKADIAKDLATKPANVFLTAATAEASRWATTCAVTAKRLRSGTRDEIQSDDPTGFELCCCARCIGARRRDRCAARRRWTGLDGDVRNGDDVCVGRLTARCHVARRAGE